MTLYIAPREIIYFRASFEVHVKKLHILYRRAFRYKRWGKQKTFHIHNLKSGLKKKNSIITQTSLKKRKVRFKTNLKNTIYNIDIIHSRILIVVALFLKYDKKQDKVENKLNWDSN